MNYDAIVVGGGIAGLTAAAYLGKSGYATLLCEKENHCGGLVNTFERNGFYYDGGIRALENSGILFPMIKQLGLELEFVKNQITIGIEDQVIWVHSEESAKEYQELLIRLYPESKAEINEIFAQIRLIMQYMDVQYGIDNPAFLDMKEDREYMLKVILPWVFKYAFTVRKITALNEPVVEYLNHYTNNQSLLDIITQHFFRETPAFFALSYLKLYLDYYYPVGGTGQLVNQLLALLQDHSVHIRTNTTITAINPENQTVSDVQGNSYGYRQLVWAADSKSLYRNINLDEITDSKTRMSIRQKRDEIEDKSGNDSVFTLYLALDLDKNYFAAKASEHFFYTPQRTGQSQAGPIPLDADRNSIEDWLGNFFSLTTYEISCPVMRDSNLAPPGKTGLIVSVLFDYQLTKTIEEMGWYQEFKKFCEECILHTLENSIYPGIKNAVLDSFSSTPLTMARMTSNTHGAITGWSFTNDPIPAESRLPKIFSSTNTPVPKIVQAGQWTYSPSGLPISILTGKLAADKIIKNLKKK
ncbi:MAG: NAD(P)/FAD-dependent oxidoreductase [Anaerolineales bacterium]|jgi:phytoene dehydrogenase-like protein